MDDFPTTFRHKANNSRGGAPSTSRAPPARPPTAQPPETKIGDQGAEYEALMTSHVLTWATAELSSGGIADFKVGTQLQGEAPGFDDVTVGTTPEASGNFGFVLVQLKHAEDAEKPLVAADILGYRADRATGRRKEWKRRVDLGKMFESYCQIRLRTPGEGYEVTDHGGNDSCSVESPRYVWLTNRAMQEGRI